MRILHTSDWHLGLSLGALSLGPDHDLFLAWLRGALREHAVDALIVAGDVFDTMQPSAEAQGRYFRFLAQVAESGVQQVVIVGGNHDSPSRLDAPAEVLAALQVRVVGGYESDGPDDRYLVPLRGRGGQVEAVCVALPYVHEFRLGVRTTELDPGLVRASFTQRFTALYARLCDAAQARWPGLPLVGTGHLTLGASSPDDYPQPIHQVGSIDGLPDSVVDPRLQHLALGHIHRCYPLADRRAWYSGTPVATGFTEASARKVLLVDLDPDVSGRASVTPIEVPRPRAMRVIEGAPAAVCAALRALRWDEPLPPALSLRVALDGPAPDLLGRVNDALAVHPDGARPVVCAVDTRAAAGAAAGAEGEALVGPSLAELQPEDVLEALCTRRGVVDPAPLRQAFAQLRAASDDDWRAMLAAAAGGAL
jgi:exonuclease SbcD